LAALSFKSAAAVAAVVDNDDDDRRSESSLGCFLGGGVASEASLSIEDLRFEPYKWIMKHIRHT
jgi:hypothetical protein